MAEAAPGFPAGSPSGPKPWRFAARRIRNFHSRSHPFGILAEASIPERTGSSAEASVPPGVHGPKPWVRRFRSPRAEARSCPKDPRAEAQGSTGGGAPTEVPLSAGRVANPKVRLPSERSPARPKADRSPFGRFTKPAAFASAEGQARHRPPGGGFVSRPAFRLAASCLVRQDAVRLGLWLGRLSSVAGRSSRPPPIAVMKRTAIKVDSACG